METYIVIGAYLAFLLGMGVAQRKLNRNVSDYFRNGCQGTWWLVGSSVLMSGISCYTFTGAAGVAFESGWSVTIIFVGGAACYLVHYLFLAPWFRQLTCDNSPGGN